MPIYAYYCERCHGQFDHLARSYDELAPACPRCGNEAVTRLIAPVGYVHQDSYHEQQLRAETRHVEEGPQAAARLLKASGRLEDSDGIYGSQAYRELIQRRSEGASDADLGDLVDDLVAAAGTSPVAQMAGAVALSQRVENRMLAEGPPDRQEDDPTAPDSQAAPARVSTRRTVTHLGWG